MTKRTWVGQYLFNIALGFDQFINVLLFGSPDESISGRLGRAAASGRPKPYVNAIRCFVDVIFAVVFGDKNHCRSSIEPEENVIEHELWSWIKDSK
jgi:hypothetical protein